MPSPHRIKQIPTNPTIMEIHEQKKWNTRPLKEKVKLSPRCLFGGRDINVIRIELNDRG